MKISKQKIEIAMVKRGLSPKNLAERCGISPQSFSTIKNRGTCTMRTAEKLCKGIGCKVEDFIEV